MLQTGLELMVIGMAVVFFFLTLLVVLLRASGTILKSLAKFMPEKAPPAAKGNSDGLRDVAIALAAVSGYKKAQAR
jgi:sodium pump decarboxylase gamma subunit